MQLAHTPRWDELPIMEPVENSSTHAHGGPSGVRCEPSVDDSGTPFAAGTRISDNIELVRLLGMGGMGSVWLAEHAALETQVAVKFMSKEVLSEPGLLARFAREAKLSARIKSPHVVQIFDFATTTEGIPYIVMEHLEGEDLETRLQSGRELTLDEATRVIVQLCKALGKAHALDIVHRDIKPDNVFLVDNDGDTLVKVLDFGIAKDASLPTGITVSGTTMGTPLYMSPEQLFDLKDVDLRSDLWSVAVVAYRCLTGRLPFQGTSFGSVCVSIHSGMFPSPSQLNNQLPPGLDDWFGRALKLDKDERFQSAHEMADAFLAELDRAGFLPGWAVRRNSSSDINVNAYATDAAGISGAPITLRPRTGTRRLRRRWTGAALAALILLGIGVTAARKGGTDVSMSATRAELISGSVFRNLHVLGPKLPPLNETKEMPALREVASSSFVPSTRATRALREHSRDPEPAGPPVADHEYDDPETASVPDAEPLPTTAPSKKAPAPPPETLVYGI
jgi:serine/threonine protein kinase